ncbi:MAG: DUF2007 domain-containing protein [Pseudomonadota bacterium]|nr:DUF2007 domain-containing protein [Pseudomonadota bacterium]
MALVELAMFQNPIAAEVARGRLASEGIETILFGGGVASLGLGSMTPARLMVDESDFQAAAAVLAEDQR